MTASASELEPAIVDAPGIEAVTAAAGEIEVASDLAAEVEAAVAPGEPESAAGAAVEAEAVETAAVDAVMAEVTVTEHEVAVAEQAAVPESVTPEAAGPEPVAPEPVTPEPVTPDMTVPQPLTPADASLAVPPVSEAVAEPLPTVEADAGEVADADADAHADAHAVADSGTECDVETGIETEAQPEPVAMLASAGAAAAVAARPVPQVPMDITSPHGPSSGGGGLPPVEPPAPLQSPSSEAPPVAGVPGEPPVLRTVRIEVPPRAGAPRAARVSSLLRAAADHGASELFLLSQARPTMRVDGSIRPIDSEVSLTAADVESMLAEVTPEPWREAVGRGDPAEWLIELADIGRVRCVAFRDHRGPGANFHVLSLRPVSLDELGVGGDARLLASESDGLVVLAGPGSDERARLVAAFVDGTHPQRSDYVITIAPRVSSSTNRAGADRQREVTVGRARADGRGGGCASPDVLVVEDVAGDAAALLIEPLAGGRLASSVPEASAAAAVGWLIARFESRRQSAAELAARTFRGRWPRCRAGPRADGRPARC